MTQSTLPEAGSTAAYELRALRVELLQGLPLFADLPQADLAEIVDSFSWEQASAGSVLMEEGEESGDLFLVVSGVFEVTVQGSPRVRLAEVEAGELLGEAALFRRVVRRSARVQTQEDGELVRLQSLSLAQLAAKGNSVPGAIEAAVLRTLARRIRISNSLIERRLRGEGSQEHGMRWFGLRGGLTQ